MNKNIIKRILIGAMILVVTLSISGCGITTRKNMYEKMKEEINEQKEKENKEIKEKTIEKLKKQYEQKIVVIEEKYSAENYSFEELEKIKEEYGVYAHDDTWENKNGDFIEGVIVEKMCLEDGTELELNSLETSNTEDKENNEEVTLIDRNGNIYYVTQTIYSEDEEPVMYVVPENVYKTLKEYEESEE